MSVAHRGKPSTLEGEEVASAEPEAVDLALLEPVLAECVREADEVIPLLRAVQKVYGYVPEATLDVVARHLRITRAKVLGVATFYSQFSLTPQGRHRVCVCRGTACHVRGSKQVLDAARDELGIDPGETSDDMQFSLETVACMGACALAPVMKVDDTYYGKLDVRRTTRVLEMYGQERSE
jgi:NADH-quinone oxidoreductase subunit E